MTDQQFEDMRQLYGELANGEFERGQHITYLRYDGKVCQGRIIWIQGPGKAKGRDGREVLFRTQYVVEGELPGGSMPDFVNETDILLVD